MKLPRLFGTAVVLGSVIAGLIALTPRAAHSTDLQDSATLVAHPTADINDVYMFPSPSNTNNVVLIMDVDSGLSATAAGTASFDPQVLYQFKIAHTSGTAASTTGTLTEDTVFQFLVTGNGSGQTLTMYGPAAPNRVGNISTVVATSSTLNIPFGKTTTLTVPDDAVPAVSSVTMQAFAGLVSDPSVFDLNRFYQLFPDRNQANHTTGESVPTPTASSFAGFSASGMTANCDTTDAATNYFSGLKTLSIVLEMPKSFLKQIAGQPASSAQPYVHLWATTSTVSGS